MTTATPCWRPQSWITLSLSAFRPVWRASNKALPSCAGFPGWEFTFEELIAEGEQVVARWTVRAIHSGDFFGIPPTGKQVAVAGTDIVRLAHGKAIEHWRIFDQLGQLQQLRVVRASGQANSSPP